MPMTRHHAEWLRLVEPAGPFLSLAVLERVFPQGLDPHDSDLSRELRAAFEEWEESHGRRGAEAIHLAWVRYVLTIALGLPPEALCEGQALPGALNARVAGHGQAIRPDLAIVAPPGSASAGKVRLLLTVHPSGQDLERVRHDARGLLSPVTAMVQLLRDTGTALGLVTNGEQWMLVHAPRGETSGTASWYASLWFEEPLTLQAFRSLLGARRFFGVAESDSLEALLAESAKDQQEVTDQLGYQVRRAVEVLVQAIDRIDKDRGRSLLRGIDDRTIYEAALTVMMRLVFVLCAEEKNLLPLSERAYVENYALSTLRDELRKDADEHGEEVLERRCDAWIRILATSRALHGGTEHESLRLLAYGGTLFDPDRFPFFEGRPSGSRWREVAADPLPVHNRTVLHLLEALQLLEVRVGRGPVEQRRLSFRALDIEQIGHVYEGLLDHVARRANVEDSPVLGLTGTRDREPEIPVRRLEESRARGESALLDYLGDETGRSTATLRRCLTQETGTEDAQRFLVACDNDQGLYDRIRPFAGLVRRDTSDFPVVVCEGGVYVTKGTDRRQTGTHYTPRTLTEPIVKHTLDPLVYVGPAEGRPEAEWRLRSAASILALRVLDMAMGSGAFLVQACRYLAEKLVEAWAAAEAAHPGRVVVTPEGTLSEGLPPECLIPSDPAERLVVARRIVADRCLYGVDVNPMAVEMAKLSLWLTTLQKDRPFSFLDHALRVGDSLLGLTDPEQLAWYHLDPARGRKVHTWVKGVQVLAREALRKATDLRRRIESFPVVEPRDAEEKRRLLAESEVLTADLSLAADLLIGTVFSAPGQVAADLDTALKTLSAEVEPLLDSAVSMEKREALRRALAARARSLLNAAKPAGLPDRRPFHWPIVFPEVFGAENAVSRGFDAIVGNPPFQGGQKITGALGTDYRSHLVHAIAGGRRGSADLCAYFFLRAGGLIREGGGFGLLATNTIAQGDTREVGLDRLSERGFVIQRAVASQKWPGTANLEVAHVWVRRGAWAGERVLENETVPAITPFLTKPARVEGRPYQLAANDGKAFQGPIVLGMGFVLSPEAALTLIEKDSRNRDVLFPYLNGEDLNSRPDQSPSRWVINFQDWPLERAEMYPDCMRIVRDRVKPERDRNPRRARRERWWQYAERQPALCSATASLAQVLVTSRVSLHHFLARVDARQVFADRLVVFAIDTVAHLAVLGSTIHEAWAHRPGATTHETRGTYFPELAFGTFPLPPITIEVTEAGSSCDATRRGVLSSNRIGLRDAYGVLHDPDNNGRDAMALREVTEQVDRAVATAYGWDDLRLDHDFRVTRLGARFTVSEEVRRETLARLLELNHERHAREAEAGLHAVRSARRPRASSASRGEGLLF